MQNAPALQAAAPVRLAINVGACLDIPTGRFVEGRRGEYILLAGITTLTGIVGIGNNFKSTILDYLMGIALARFKKSTGSSYDTESSKQEWHMAETMGRLEDYRGENPFESGRWVVTDKTVYSGNKYYAVMKEHLQDRIDKPKPHMIETPFWNRGRTGPLMMMQPIFSQIDSFSEFETDDAIEIQDKNELGDSGANMLHQRQGLAKTRILMEAPRLHGSSFSFCLWSAHLGKESTVQQGGGGKQIPIQKLTTLKNGDKIKGVTDKFTFAMQNCFNASGSRALTNDSTNAPEYPRSSDDNLKRDTDLMTVNLTNLRGKSGPSGMPIRLVVSQSEGVLPTLTEFHHIKEFGRYGLEGSNVSYVVSLYPEVKLGRTTVRSLIDSDPLLRRAIQITSEMCQMSYLWHHLEEGLLCTPKELYDDLKAMGYDWNVLLNTRGWWTVNEEGELPFLSTMDLLRMRKKLYIPYWYKDPAFATFLARLTTTAEPVSDTKTSSVAA